MKKSLYIILWVLCVLITGILPVSGQAHFRVISDIPHLPQIDPAAITTPEVGMLIFSIPDSKPLIYTGSGWETLCTGNITSITAREYFVVKNGIPFLPAFSSPPTGILSSGTIYYSTISKALMVYNGTGWTRLAAMLTGTLAASNGFVAGVGVKTVKLPVLSSNPSPAGLVAGAFYINSLSKIIRYFDGTMWQDISCQAVVQTLPLTSVAGYTATGGGDVTTNGSSPVTLTGVCWSTTADPDTLLTTKTRQATTGLGIGIFSSPITGLLPLTTYHVRAYAVNSQGLVYGEDRTFTTPIAPPTIITLDANGISSISAQSGGDISSDGGASVTSRGIIYSSVSDPLTDFLHTVTNDGSGIGYFTSSLNGLLGNTVYYVRSYAVNSGGTAYGNLIQITTSLPVIAGLDTDLTISNITGTTAIATATILNNGGAHITDRGVCITSDHVIYNCIPSSTVNPTDVGTFTVDLSGLTPGTTYSVKAYADNSAGRIYSSEVSFTTASLAHITTTAPSGLAGTIANSGGEVLDAGYSVITSRGICWDTLPDPTINLSTKTTEILTGDGTGVFASVMTGLMAGKTYYVRAYVINIAGVAYGQQEQITLPDFPRVVTLAASSLFNTTATVGGNVLSDGGSPITERGVCWSPLPVPVYSNLHTSDGDGLGIYMSILTGLTPRTVCHYRAYAINAVGISYGEDRTFSIEPDAPTIITLNITAISSVNATSGGDITSNGGAPITRRGIIWSTLGDPVDDPDQFITNDGSGVGEFPSDMKHLLGNTTYYVRAYAVNAYGTAYGNLLSFKTLPPVLSVLNPPTFSNTVNTASTATFLILHNGGAPITDRGVCYYTTDPANSTCESSTTVNPLDIGTFIVNMQNLVSGTTYYLKAYATNSVGTAYSNETSFKTTSLPIVTTTVPDQIQGRTVYSGGTVFYVGDDILQARGVVWSTSPNPTIDLDTKTSEAVTGIGTGIYTSHLTGLTPNTTYYVRAYAINSDGVGYGENLSFLTADYAMLVTTTPHSMTTNYAVLGGEIYSDGNSAVTERGVCYNTSPNPTYSDSHVADPEAAGIGTFVIQPFKNGNLIMGGLRENTKFYVRAYAVNSAGVAYGNIDSMMMQPSQLITYDASSITTTSFTMSGTVNSSGYRDIGTKGFVWSTTNTKPTLSDNSSYEGYWAGGIGRNIYNLPTDTKYYYRVYAYTSIGLKYANVDSVSTLPSLLATVTTAHPSAMGSSSAVSGGTVSFNGNTAITERGVCWSISPNPVYSGNHTVTGSGTGTFVTNLTNLLGSTKYYTRAYAINTAGIGYGNPDSLVTAPPVLPAVSTTDAINIGSVKAVGRGNVSDAGGATVTETGICWNMTGDPAITDNNAKAGSGTGSFSAPITGLTPVTKYYMRAYAVNKVGLAYGNVITFSTFTLATIVTSPVSAITNITATGGGQISSDGGTPVTSSGICWSTAGDPTINDPHTTGDIGIGTFIHSMTGLMGSITYYVRAYATNEAGTAYGQVQSFLTLPPVIPTLTVTPATNGSNGLYVNAGGTIISNGGGLITTEGLVWSTGPSFVPDTVVINRSTIGGSGNFNAVADRLQPGRTYYIRAYATNSAGTGYSDNVVTITTYDYPTVTTVPPDLSSVTSMSVQTGGNITSDGGTEVTENGLCWSVDSPPTISDSTVVNGVGTVSFIRTLTNLFGNITYYVRAYAKNGVGVAYGQVETFTTLPPVLATITTLSSYPTSSTTAAGGGNITTNGGAMVTTRGMVWANNPAFIPDTVVVNRTAITGYYVGSYKSSITGLKAGTNYYVRAYVVNSIGVTYGELSSFLTPTLPTVFTNYANPNGPTKGNVGAIITNRGGASISAKGVVWSTVMDFNPDTVQVNRMPSTSSDSIFGLALKDLKGGTTYYVVGYATNIAGTTYGNMLSFTTDPAQVATVTTTEAVNISWTSITSGGIISDNGGEPITTRGMIWSTTRGFRPDTEIVNRTATTGLDDKQFTSVINGLKVNTAYYARAYVANSIGIAYGNEISFIPLSIQTLPAAAGSDGYTASGGGEVTGDTNTAASISNEGIIWSLAHDPTVALSTKTSISSGPVSTGQFYNEMANLTPAATYYVRAYAITSRGIAYGNEVSFTTPVALPVLTTNVGTPISRSSVFTGGKISTNGNGAISAKGIIWSTNPNFNPDTVVVNRTMDGTGSSNFGSTAIGLQLSTSYYIRAYATNSAGTAYGNQVTVSIFPTAPMLNTVDPTAVTGYSAASGGAITMDGGSDITLKGMCWATHSNPTVGDFKTTNGAGMSAFSQGITGLLPNTLYYVRSYAVNSIGTGYGSEKTLLTNGVPTLTATYPVTNIIATTATGGGEITDDGRSPILIRGIVWGIYSKPTIALTTKTVDDTTRTIGSFLAKMSGLQANTTYYVRAYATNGVGAGYGSETTFATLPVMLPSLTTIHPFSVDSMKATGGGNIYDNGGMPVTSRGICWSTTAVPNPTTALLTKINNAKGGDSIYTNTMAGLSPGTKYYIRAYAINTKGTGYGNLDSLTTMAIHATVSNVVMSGFTQNSAIGSATVITSGGSPVTVRGFCWNTTGNPTIANDTLQTGVGIGSFADTLKNLVEGPTYYVRAFAITSAGISYSALVSSFKICPSSFTVMHYEGLNGAPVTKTVTYSSVSSNVSGSARCWITQNLGADHQAVSATDGTEASAGWYWQFNRMQGYQYTTSRYPTTWNAAISETSDWVKGNDPCNLLLGSGWRIPSNIEWTNADGAPQNWNNYTGTYGSELKLHAGGYLINGAITTTRGTTGEFWTGTQISATNGGNLGFNSTISTLQSNDKATYGFSLRCLRDSITIAKPTVSNVSLSTMTKTTAVVIAAVTPDGGSAVTSRGFYWNTTGIPLITDNPIPMGAGTGIFTDTIRGLSEGITYYIGAYATNSEGTTFSPIVTAFKVCPSVFTVQHVEGLNGAPVSKTVVYHAVSSTYSGAARCWITQNLGADHQATAVTDATEPSAGWYWQFNRMKGYQYGTGRMPSSTWIATISEPANWMPETDPCNRMLGGGWRIPTSIEWTTVDGAPQNWSTYNDAFSSPLKLHNAGNLNNATGVLSSPGTQGNYWGSTSSALTTAYDLQIQSAASAVIFNAKTYGFSLRCLRDTIVVSTASVSNVTFSGMTLTSADISAIVTPDGGSAVTERGFCWNTTGNPTISDHKIANGVDVGNFTSTITGLVEGPTYYVRGYALNAIGLAYSTDVTSFRVCPPVFTVQHIEGIDGAPVSKKVAYHSVSSMLSGKAVCWLTQNLGADSIATSNTDATEASGGWYWQFNRIQGFKNDGIIRTPATSWISISESSNWTPTNDPCARMLGNGWRIPTNTDWVNVIANGNLATAMAYDSPLKMHMAGNLENGSFINKRGVSYGIYWSNTQSAATTGYSMYFSTAGSVTYNLHSKSLYGFSIRCLRDTIVVSQPSVGAVSISISSMTGTTADATSAIGSDGGAPVTARGFCWNVTGNPTLSDNSVTNGTGGTGNFGGTITGLSEGPKFYVRAYATNSAGTSYSEGSGFSAILTSICPDTFNIQHTLGFRGAPVTKSVTYHAIGSYRSGSAKCWLAQNLGADRQATSAVDATEASGGWYFQFNHSLGYKNSGATTPNAWITGFNEAADWTAINDPCAIMLGADWRLPTSIEWTNVNNAPQTWTTHTDAYNSELKLHNAGYLALSNGTTAGRGTQGNYWSNTRASTTFGYDLQFAAGSSAVISNDKAYGFSVRCLREGIVKMPPTLSNVIISTTTDTTAVGSAKIIVDGGSVVLTRGICWNTTGNPTVNDNYIPANLTDTTFNGLITGLNQGPTYYVRAYATNKIGLGYSSQTTTFNICPSAFDILHSVLFNGSPVTKTVTYHSVNSTLSGAARCWLTQNLGSDRPANAANDTTNAAAGWYWQFNRIQGFKANGAILTPSVGWVSTAISESVNWTAATDPCNILLSAGWRIPTSTEWSTAVTNGGWGSKNAFASELKLHYGGQIKTAAIADRGIFGYYWSSMQTAVTTASDLEFSAATGISQVVSTTKSGVARSLRCLRDNLVVSPPSVSPITVVQLADSIIGSATVTPDGGAPVTARGICWGTQNLPTITDNVMISGTGVGNFVSIISGLKDGFTYNIRAFATNTAGTTYSPNVYSFKICNPVKVVHVAGSNGAPVSKAVTYSVVSTNVTNKLMCWLAQNLGSDKQAVSATDGSDAAAGWYFQFNRGQGYKHDGTTRTPNAYAWATANGENSGWSATNDPCSNLLSGGWRLPTSTEWTTAKNTLGWTNYSTTYNSVLKIHAAGFLAAAGGGLINRGSEVRYSSSNQNTGNTNNAFMFYASSSGLNPVNEYVKADATSVRCIRDTLVISTPTVSNVDIPTATMTSNSAVGNAAVSSDGSSAVTERGLVWNTTGTAPTVTDNKIIDGVAGMGTFSDSITGLKQGPVYYVRAYAVNAKGTAYSPAISNFKICPTSFTVMHVEGMNGAPVTKTVIYHSISTYMTSGISKCWLTQNLGAAIQAVSATDMTEDAAGWYFQFNRSQGYQFTSSRYPVTSWIPGIGESSNWLPANDPCSLLIGNGWRLPTNSEWSTANASPQNWGNYNSTYSSVLKIHAAGFLTAAAGASTNRGSEVRYASSNQNTGNTNNAFMLYASSTTINPVNEYNKADAISVRCLLDISAVSTPAVSNVLVPAITITSNSAVATANISADGGTPVTERGFVWNTTGAAPTIADNKSMDSSTGIGSFSTTLTGLIEIKNYYIRAYAINAQGIVYSLSTTQIKVCNPVTVTHVAGSAGSPLSRTITYPVVSANVSNKLMCWLAQNLGAEQQAASGNDGSDAAAGWYFQFNRGQGYATSGTTRTPNAFAWTAANGENAAWTTANDPCVVMIGQGWRLPTSSEWSTAAAAPRNWSNYNITYSSVLKIHAAGFLSAVSGTLTNRGSEIRYSSSNQNTGNTNNAFMFYATSIGLNPVNEYNKADATSVRCLRDTMVISTPTVSNVDIPTATMTSNSAVGYAAVSSDGGSALTERGLVWNTTGTAPTIADHKIIDAVAGMGTFSDIIAGLIQGPIYYVRAYAINAKGITYSPAISNFKICPTSFTVMHVEGMNGAPVTKTVIYHSISTYISGGVSKCWLTQNLGATVQAVSATDNSEDASGWYFQFNRSQGFQYTTSRYPVTSWVPGIGDSNNWLPANDPCTLLLGNGWRLPLKSEWQIAATSPQNWGSYTSTFSSVLKIHAAGWLNYDTGNFSSRGSDGMYWSSTQNPGNTNNAYELRINSGLNSAEEQNKAYATPVRCLLDISAAATPAISNVLVPTATITFNSALASANISADGGTPVTERGFVWNTTGAVPTIADNKIVDVSTGIGSFSTTLTGLLEVKNYYIRAYAINAQGIVYSLSTTQIKVCNPVTVTHVAGSAGSPVSRTITYPVVSANVSNKLMCWLAQNLGAEQQAASGNDGLDAAAGWYFQFNRGQGYATSGTTRTPNAFAWTAANGENAAWTTANDPCVVMIGQGWRLPTSSEWSTAAAAPRNWSNYNITYSSVLKIHAAGFLSAATGTLTNRGSEIRYSTSNQNTGNTNNAFMFYASLTGLNPANEYNKADATSVRCLRDTMVISTPTVSNVDIPTATMTSSSGVGYAAVSSDGGSALTERGLVWNTTGSAPTIADHKIIDAVAGMGTFSDSITGLIQGPVYYVRAYAINAKGITYSPAISNFKICPTAFTVMHVEGMNGAPVTKTVIYHSISTFISGGVSKCWLTQNLGATVQAASANDNTEASSGWYFQFNRSQGYQYTTSRYPVTSWVPGIGDSNNWLPANDPCTLLLGNGWRLPLKSEWQIAATSPQNWGSYTSTFSSVLKIHAAGWLNYDTGNSSSRGLDGMYWSSTQNPGNTNNAFELRINAGLNSAEEQNKAYATPVRCLLDISAAATPAISNVLVPAATITSNSALATAYISADGGTPVTERGFVWNTTGTTPTITDIKILDSVTGIGSFSTTLTGLTENKNYYIRAYAINAQGIVYSLSTTQIKICNPVTVTHVAGSAGAPLSRTITYPVVSANVSNKLMCWLAQNLGAEQQAVSGNDGSDAAAGWYFQFNRGQGYATSGTTRTPNAYAWPIANGENAAWTIANDPCVVMIGQGWRLPTSSEWSIAAAAPRNWGNYNITFNSVLKIHAAGFLSAASGTLTNRGSEIRYSTSNQNTGNTNNAFMFYASLTGLNPANEYNKADATSVRCLRDTLVFSTPTVSNVDIPTATMTSNSAVGNTAVSSDGGSALTERGLVWNTTGTAPTVTDHKIIDAVAGMGTFSDIIAGLIQGPVYYVRAYAINAKGTTYSPAISNFKICPTSFTVMHVEGMNGAPVTKTVIYHSISTYISGGVSKCWLTQNLGAKVQAVSATDNTEDASGWYFQFNRSQGYQYTTSRYPVTSWVPGIGDSNNWLPANDPCTLLLGNGWRLPTSSEWSTADASPQNWGSYNSTYSSELKIHAAGWLNYDTGNSSNRGSDGMYWSSTQNPGNTNNAYELRINTGINPAEEQNKAYATPVRCLLEISAVATPAISNVLVPAGNITSNSAEATANISTDGGTTITERGFVWNTTGAAPTIADNKIVDISTGIGSFSTTLTGLLEVKNYYIRAYAINAQGIVYSLSTTQIKICNPVTVTHVAGSAGAPLSRTITYPVVSANVTNKLMCWLAQNLGAEQQATSGNDGSDAAAGWYFQFNRGQGYATSGTIRTPNAYAWPIANGENAAWTTANDPCVAMIGQGWRLPTSSEWSIAAAAPRNWSNYNITYGSVLKIHAAGLLLAASGTLTNRGTEIRYSTSNQNTGNTNNAFMFYATSLGLNPANDYNKADATSVRCLRDTLVISTPTVSNVDIPTTTMTTNSGVGNAAVSSDGGSALTERGLVWNTTGIAPTVTDNKIIDPATGMGIFSDIIAGLIQGPVYYVRAYAINAKGTTYSPAISNFKICPTTFTVMHVEGMNGAPVTKTVTYHSINTSISGGVSKCWLTQNLGATVQAVSATDNTEDASGWYFQFNRSQGFQYTTSRYPVTSWVPGIGDSNNWLPANDPCTLLLGNGWRLPTSSEWSTADASPQNWGSYNSTYSSVLKIHAAGFLAAASGAIINRGSEVRYSSGSQNTGNTNNAFMLYASSSTINPVNDYNKADATSVRCLLDISAVAAPAISNVLVPAANITSNSAEATSNISTDGGTPVTERGFVWNTTGIAPIIGDNKIMDGGTGIGSFSTTLTGLLEVKNYYIRAYAINAQGIVYSLTTTQIKICNPVTVVHVAGLNGAPVSKTVTYSVVGSNVTNKQMCWLAQNLGADQQAASGTDGSEASAGWYFQFNRLKGYKHDGSTRTPNASWTTGNGENAAWSVANDPCVVMIGQGWRLPTSSEWSIAAAAPRNWGNYNITYGSILKIHAAGFLSAASGTLTNRGSEIRYSSSNQNTGNTNNAFMFYASSTGLNPVNDYNKADATSVRCIRDVLIVP